MSIGDVIIRTAQPTDSRAVATVHVTSWQQAYRGLIPDSFLARMSIDKREAIWNETIATGDPELWVAEVSGDIVGWACVSASRDDDATPQTGEIQAIYLDAAYWRRGIGTLLWAKARQRLIERGFNSATLWALADNARAIRFYESQGFVPSAAPSRSSERDGKRLEEVRYEIRLD